MPTRRAVWWHFLCSAMLVASAHAQSLLLDVVPGFDGICPDQGCYAVTVWVQGERSGALPASCEVEVTATSWNGSAYARKPITLSGGWVSQPVELLLCTPDEPYEITARLILRGRVLAISKPVSGTTAQWYPLLVGLGTEGSALTYLPQRSLGVVSIEGRLVSTEHSPPSPPSHLLPFGSENRRFFIGRVRHSLPPDNMLAYRGAAAVSLDDRAWDTLTEQQQQALLHYVFSGGLLVVHGVDINRLQSLMPSGLLPVEPLGLSQVPANALARWLPSLGKSTVKVVVVRTRPLGRAQTVLHHSGIPLVVTARKGLGQVVFLAFDPTQPPFTGNEAAHSLWKNLLRLQVARFSSPTAVFPGGDAFQWSAPLPDGKEFYSELVRAMVNAIAAKPVPLNWLITYLGVYILVLIPLNYVVLRKLDRLHLSWFTLPLLATFTSLVGYLVAARVQTGSHQMRQWTALYASSGSPQAIVESDWVLYSAHTQRYRLRAKVDGTILENSPSDLQARRVAETPQDIPADVRDVPIPLWSARSFHLSGFLTLPGSVNISAERGRGALRLRVRNRTPYPLKKMYLVTPSGIVPLRATCAPGAQTDLHIQPDARLFLPSWSNLPDYYAYRALRSDTGNGEDWHERAQSRWLGLVWSRLRRSMNRPFPVRGESALSEGNTRGVLVAEVEQFPQVVEITPSSPSVQRATLLAVSFDLQGGAP